MTDQLFAQLKPVRRRQQWLLVLRFAVSGLLIGSLTAIVLAIGRLLGMPVSSGMVISAVAAGTVIGLLIGLICRQSWKTAAAAVDSRYKLKDRTATALAFLDKPQETPLYELQIGDAVDHLKRVDAPEVAPLVVPKTLPYACAALIAAVVLVFIPLKGQTATAGPTASLEEIVNEAEQLEEAMVEELEKLAALEPNEELDKLVERLKDLVDEMKAPDVDHRDALAKLSEMQAAIASAQAEYNLEAVDAKLKSLGEALAPAAAMKAASSALEEGQHDKAAKALEEADPSKITRKDARAVVDKLKKLAQEMQDAGQGQLSDGTRKMADGIEREKPSQCKSGACKLAGLCRKQGLRKKIGKCLGSQLTRLAECKGKCRGRKNGGNNVAKSNSPSNSWGRGASGNPFGDEQTSLDGKRNREDVTGVHGDGPSDKAVSHAAGGREQAARSYRERYQRFRKMSEAVLDSEPLPLGHRQTIRRYFESIRPQNADSDDVAAPAGSPE